ncbi:hypothetical protein BH23VER1_BH23VER1_19580 [soil metagenome]
MHTPSPPRPRLLAALAATLALSWALPAAAQEPAATTLIPFGADWRYFDQGSEPKGWKSPDFDDSTWAEGPGELGFGDGDEATVVSFGPSSSNKYPTTYFRKTFTVSDASEFTSLELSIVRDDGAVVYFNGSEVARSNLPAGEILYDTYALTGLGTPAEQTPVVIQLSAALLSEGTNFIAVEIHQATADSSDLSFDLALTASQERETVTDAAKADGIAYFLMTLPNRVLRYDLDAQGWLSPIALPSIATPLVGFDVGPTGIVAATSSTVFRFPTDGTGAPVEVLSSSGIVDVTSAGEAIVVAATDAIHSFDAATGAALDSESVTAASPIARIVTIPDLFPAVVAYGGSRSERRIARSAVDAGMLATHSTTHVSGGASSENGHLFLYPDGARVLTSSGARRNTVDLSSNGSLQTSVRWADFFGDTAIVAEGAGLSAHSGLHAPLGSRTLAIDPAVVFVAGADAVGFGLPTEEGADSLPVEIVALTDLGVAAPSPPPPSLIGLQFAPKGVFVDVRGTLNLLDKNDQALVQWSPTTGPAGASVPVEGTPDHVGYSPARDLALLGHANGAFFLQGLAPGSPSIYVGTLDSPAKGVFPLADGFLVPTTDIFKTYYYDLRPGLEGFSLVSDFPVRTVWGVGGGPDPVLYASPGLRSGIERYPVSPADPTNLVPEDNTTAFQSIFAIDNGAPRLIGDGGTIFNSETFATERFLEGLVTAATFSGGALWTGRLLGFSDTTEISRRASPTLTPDPATVLPGSLHSLVASPDGGIYAVLMEDGRPTVTKFDAAGAVAAVSPRRPAIPVPNLASVTQTTATVAWAHEGDNATGFRIYYRASTSEAFAPVATVQAAVRQATVDGTVSGGQLKISALGQVGESELSTAVIILAHGAPQPLPYNLSATAATATTVTLNWEDNADDETGFRIRRVNSYQDWVFTLPANTTTFTDTGLTSPRQFYNVTAFNAAGNGPSSDFVVTFHPLADDVPPSAVGIVTTDPGDPPSTALKVRWSSTYPGETGFYIERLLAGSDDGFELLAITPANQDWFVDSGLSPSTGYRYRVSAFNEVGFSQAVESAVRTTSPARFSGLSTLHGGIAYFTLAGPDEVSRYDMVAGAWLAPLTSVAAPTALHAGDSGVFVMQGKLINRLVEGGAPVPLAYQRTEASGFASTPTGLLTSTFYLFDPSTGLFLGQLADRNSPSYGDGAGDALVRDPVSGDLFTLGRELIRYASTGAQLASISLPGTGSPSLMLSPDRTSLYTQDGTVLDAVTLTPRGEIGDWDALTFAQDGTPIAAVGSTVFAFDADLIVTGRYDFDQPLAEIDASGAALVALLVDPTTPTGIRPETVDLAAISPVPAAPTARARFGSGAIFSDAAGTIYFLAKSDRALYRWSSTFRQYLPPIPFQRTPADADYSPALDRILVAFPSGSVVQFDPATAVPQAFAFSRGPLRSVTAAGDFTVVTSEESGKPVIVFGPDGAEIPQTFSLPAIESPVYSADLGALLYSHVSIGFNKSVRKSTVGSNGQISPPVTSSSSRSEFPTAVSVSADGSYVYESSTRKVLSGATLAVVSSVPAPIFETPFQSAAWVHNTLVTLTSSHTGSTVATQEAPGFGIAPRGTVPGEPLAVVPLGPLVAVVTLVSDAPAIHLLDPATGILEKAFPYRPAAPSDLAVTGRTLSSITFSWSPSTDASGYVIEYRAGDGSWTAVDLPGSPPMATLSGLAPGSDYLFRITANSAAFEGFPSAPTPASPLAYAGQPDGAPYRLRLVRADATSATIAWDDNDAGTGFRVYRSGPFPGPATLLAEIAPGQTSFTDTGLMWFTPYTYTVRAHTPAGEGTSSPPLAVRTLERPGTVPDQVTNLTAELVPDFGVRLRWEDVSTDEDGFIIYGFSGGEIARLPPGSTTFELSDLESRGHSFYVVAFNAFGQTPLSESPRVSITVPRAGGSFLNVSDNAGDLHYFALDGPERIERFDAESGLWLAPLPLTSRARAIAATDVAVFVATDDRRLLRFETATGAVTELVADTGTAANWLLEDDGRIGYLQSATTMAIVNATDGSPIRTTVVSPVITGTADPAAYSRDGRTLFSFRASTGRYLRATRFDDGLNVISGEIPTGNDWKPSTTGRPMLVPRSNQVTTGSGVIQDQADLTFVDAIARPTPVSSTGPLPIIDISDHPEGSIYFANVEGLTRLDPSYTDIGSLPLPDVLRIAARPDGAIAFVDDGRSPHGMTAVPLAESLFLPRPPAEAPLDAIPSVVASNTFVDGGMVFALDTARRVITAHSTTTGEPVATVLLPAPAVPSLLAGADGLHTGFVATTAGEIFAFDTVSPQQATTIGAVPAGIVSMTIVEGNLAIARSDLLELFILAPDGEILSSSTEVDASARIPRSATFDPALSRLYRTERPNSSSTRFGFDPVMAGQLAGARSSVTLSPTSLANPFAIAPDGGHTLFASGHRVSSSLAVTAGSFTPADDEPIIDFAWSGSRLFSASRFGQSTQIAERHPVSGHETGPRRPLLGSPVALHARPDGALVAVTLRAAAGLLVTILDPDLEIDAQGGAVAPPILLSPLHGARGDLGDSVTLAADPVGHPPFGYQWLFDGVPITGANSATLAVGPLAYGNEGTYTLEVTDQNGLAQFETFIGVGPPAVPFYAPGNLLVNSSGTVYEFTPSGAFVTTTTLDFQFGSKDSGGVTIDRYGRLHGMVSLASNPPVIVSRDPVTRLTSSTPHASSALSLTLVEWGDDLVTPGAAFDIKSGLSRPFALPFSATPSAFARLTDDIFIAASTGSDSILRYSLSAGAELPPIPLDRPLSNIRALAAGPGGDLFVADQPNLYRFDASGSTIASAPSVLGPTSAIASLAFADHHTLAVRGLSGSVKTRAPDLAARLTVGFSSSSGAGMTWVPSLISQEPATAFTTDPATGLAARSLVLHNNSPKTYAAIRVVVHGLPSGVALANGHGNDEFGRPQVYDGRAFHPGTSRQLTLNLTGDVPPTTNPGDVVLQVIPVASDPIRDRRPAFAIADIVRSDDGAWTASLNTDPGTLYKFQASTDAITWTDFSPTIRAAGTRLLSPAVEPSSLGTLLIRAVTVE